MNSKAYLPFKASMVALLLISSVAHAQPPEGGRVRRGFGGPGDLGPPRGEAQMGRGEERGFGRGGLGGPGGRGPEPLIRMMPLFIALDADKDGIISEEEIKKATEALLTLDANKDGKLVLEELMPEFPGMGRGRDFPPEGDRMRGPRAPAASAEAFVSRLLSFDKDGDGKLSAEELPERMKRIMSRIDENEDGFATKEELTKMGERLSEGRGEGPGSEGRGEGPGSEGRAEGPGRGRLDRGRPESETPGGERPSRPDSDRP